MWKTFASLMCAPMHFESNTMRFTHSHFSASAAVQESASYLHQSRHVCTRAYYIIFVDPLNGPHGLSQALWKYVCMETTAHTKAGSDMLRAHFLASISHTSQLVVYNV